MTLTPTSPANPAAARPAADTSPLKAVTPPTARTTLGRNPPADRAADRVHLNPCYIQVSTVYNRYVEFLRTRI